MKAEVKELEFFLEDHIVNHFQDKSGKLKMVLRMLPASKKIEIFEYITHTSVMEHPAFQERFPGTIFYPDKVS